MGRAQYRRLLAQAYDIDKPEAPPLELAYYRSLASRTGGPVLEVMCGSGRFLLPLLAEGVDIDGVDASGDMLAACRAKGGEAVVGRLFEQEVQSLDLPRRYALVFCGGGSFGLLIDDGDIADALSSFGSVLAPGGVLALEVETPAPSPRPGTWTGRWWRRDDGELIVLRMLHGRREHDVEEALGIYELYLDGVYVESEVDEWVRRFWTSEAITGAVAAAGFRDVRLTTAFEQSGPRPEDGIVSLTARRDHA